MTGDGAGQAGETCCGLHPRVASLFAGYMTSSCLMLVANKYAVVLIPQPSLLLCIQTASSVLFVLLLKWTGLAPHEVRLCPERRTAFLFTILSFSFLATIYTNMMVLRWTGVNAFVVLRCAAPLPVALLDWLFLGRELPSVKSVLAMVGIASCATGYVLLKLHRAGEQGYVPKAGKEYNFNKGALWGAGWLIMFLWDQVFIKHVVDTVKTTGLERVLYQNGYAAPVLCAVAVLGIDGSSQAASGTAALRARSWSAEDAAAIGIPCLLGTVLSYAGLSLRSEITATAFTVAGVVCKLASILANEVVLGEDRDVLRLACVTGAIGFGSLYRQAPMRSAPPTGDNSEQSATENRSTTPKTELRRYNQPQ